MLQVKINSFSYSQGTTLKNIHFGLKPGEHLSILGESGCGKSTLLHIVYGLLHLEDGSISYNGKKLLGPSKTLIPGELFMKLVAQEFNIMPFSTVSENLGAHLSRFDHINDEKRIVELLEVIEMGDYKNVMVKNLSGGQKQRVALAKALANEPEILLLDEPFSNIDSFRKNKLRRKLFNHLKKKNIGCIIATHDSGEALAFSDEIIILRNGTTELQGPAEEVYRNVADEYQASFFGDVNLLPKSLFFPENTDEKIIVFPHQLKISTQKNASLKVMVRQSYFKGSHFLIEGNDGGKQIFFESPIKLEQGQIYWLEYTSAVNKNHDGIPPTFEY